MINQGYEPRVRSLQASRFNEFASNPKKSVWQGISFSYLHSNKYYSNRLRRWFNKAMALLKGAMELNKYRHHISAVYYYNPRYTDSIRLLHYAKRISLPIVVDQTELFSTINPRSRKDEKDIAKLADLLMVISYKLKNHFEQNYECGNVVQIPIAVDMERFNAPEQELSHTIGYLGSFAAKDGITDILSAYTKAKQLFPELKLRLIGHSTVAQQNISSSDDIVFTGSIKAEQIPQELAKCDTLILNRVNTPFAAYGFPYKLGEYFASKRPVLASQIDGYLNELPKDLVFGYTPADVKALSRAIIFRYHHPEETNKMVEKAHEYALRHFNHQTVGKQFTSQINKLLS